VEEDGVQCPCPTTYAPPYSRCRLNWTAKLPKSSTAKVMLLSETEGGGFVVASAAKDEAIPAGAVRAFDTSFPSLPLRRRGGTQVHQVSIGAERECMHVPPLMLAAHTLCTQRHTLSPTFVSEILAFGSVAKRRRYVSTSGAH
jgi:hypothetical protein